VDDGLEEGERREAPDRAGLCHLPLAVAALKNSAGFINFLASIDRIHPIEALYLTAGHHLHRALHRLLPAVPDTPRLVCCFPRDLAFQGLSRTRCLNACHVTFPEDL